MSAALSSSYTLNPYLHKSVSLESSSSLGDDRDSVATGSVAIKWIDQENGRTESQSVACWEDPVAYFPQPDLNVVSAREVRRNARVTFQPQRGKLIAGALRVLPDHQRIVHNLEMLSPADISALFSFLATSPDAMRMLCFQHRGNVIVQMLQLFPDDVRCEAIRMFLLDNLSLLATRKLGAVAVVQAYIVSRADFQKRMANRLLEDLTKLAIHEYGSFVVSAFFDESLCAGDFHAEFLQQAWEAYGTSDTSLMKIANSQRGRRSLDALMSNAQRGFLRAEIVTHLHDLLNKHSDARRGARILQEINKFR